MGIIENLPQIGKCDACEYLSVRLLNPPLVRIDERDTREYDGERVLFKCGAGPADIYRVIKHHFDGTLTCLAPEAHPGSRYCFRCWDGYVWPALRHYAINMPPEMQHDPLNPWRDAKWISRGREQLDRIMA